MTKTKIMHHSIHPPLLDNLQRVACLNIFWEDQLPSVLVIDAFDKQGERSAEWYRRCCL